MADPASNVEQRVDVKLARPYIEYGRISPAELQAFDESFSRTRTWVIIATTVGAAMILPYGIWVRPKAGFFERMAVGGGLSIVGSSTAALMGVKSMRDELMLTNPDPRQAIEKLELYQRLVLSTQDPIKYPAPPIEFPGEREVPLPGATTRALQEQQPGPFQGSSGRPFPMPSYTKYGGGAEEEKKQGDVLRDSQGRPFPGQQQGHDASNPDEREFGRERARERELGGGRLTASGQGDEQMSELERATRANPTSFALLGSRSTLPSSSTSSTLSTSPSQDFSTAPVPPPPSTSSSSWFGRNSSSATQQQQTDREREQAEFDRLLERERKAVDGPVTSAPAAAGGGAGENRWDQLRRAAGVGGGGGGGNGGSGEKIW